MGITNKYPFIYKSLLWIVYAITLLYYFYTYFHGYFLSFPNKVQGLNFANANKPISKISR